VKRWGSSVRNTANPTIASKLSSRVFESPRHRVALAIAPPTISATCGVRNRGWIRLSEVKKIPSSAAETGMRPESRIQPFRVQSPAASEAHRITLEPALPAILAAASAIGRIEPATASFGITPATAVAAARNTTVPIA
jgi:hypothetical protein